MPMSPERREQIEKLVSHSIKANEALHSEGFKRDTTPYQYELAKATQKLMDMIIAPFVEELEQETKEGDE